jgi:predicted acylesterase/phospholipase RssA
VETRCQEKAIVNLQDLLRAEREEIVKLRAKRKMNLPEDAPTVGLAFSGGGIRSATINLGILQGLAKYKLLKRIDYLSTVSGGGYIGGWLARWIYELGIEKVEERLGKPEHDAGEVEPAPVTFLRDYSNYLTPRTGLLGADAWGAVATYLRNVMLNQTILIAFLGAILFVPWILGGFLDYGSVWDSKMLFIAVSAGILMVFALAAGVVNTSTCAGNEQTSQDRTGNSKDKKDKDELDWTSQRAVLIRVVLPLFAGAFCLNYIMWRDFHDWRLRSCVLAAVVVYTLGHFVGWVVSKAKFGLQWKGVPAFWNILWAVPSGVLAGIAVHALKHLAEIWLENPTGGKWMAVCWGPPLLVLGFLLVGTLHIGMAKFALRNESYEWWARLGGWLMLWGLFWAALFGLAIFVPQLVFKLSAYLSGPALWAKRAAIVGWIVHSGLGARFGWSSKTSGKPGTQSFKEIVAKLAPFVFVGGLLIFLSTAAYTLALAINHLPLDDQAHWWEETAAIPALTFMKLAMGLALLTAFLSWRVDINRFSMNLLYRNRLVRCYLGASNEHRNAQRFTGFDPADDVKLACLADVAACDPDELSGGPQGFDGPYPILNSTLNVTQGRRLAWQERKAESFILTPKYCGFDYPEMREPGNQKFAEAKGAETGAYHRTSEWAMRENGITLGTAIAISGAAVSPNMGFHTFPPLAFLMTVFNVRLGDWLANPRYSNDKFLEPVSTALKRLAKRKSGAEKLRIEEEKKAVASPEGGPRSSLLYLLFELFGTTNDVSKYVYLTDGAHFENLALYELVRRECDFIIASDAGEDGGYVFADLANAIRKCRTDLGAEIVLNLAPITANPQTGFAKSHAVRGEIHYRSGKTGQILYFKSCLTGREPNDVKDYRRLNPEFPQQSTADQWFDESQFESYRELGLFAANSVLSRANSPAPSIDTVFAAASAE